MSRFIEMIVGGLAGTVTQSLEVAIVKHHACVRMTFGSGPMHGKSRVA
jgi:hypothetical protein